MKFRNLLAALCITLSPLSNAAIIYSTDVTDFDLTLESFPTTGFTYADIVSNSGNITLDNAVGVGNPATTNHIFTEWGGSGMVGQEYALSGDENFNVSFSSLQNVFAFNYEDDSVASTFTLTFFNGATNVGSSSFVTSSFDTTEFIGFISDAEFDLVQVRENDGGFNSNEYFQFYTATVKVSEPAPLAIMALGLMMLGLRAKSKA